MAALALSERVSSEGAVGEPEATALGVNPCPPLSAGLSGHAHDATDTIAIAKLREERAWE
jgi:hypothetical protein